MSNTESTSGAVANVGVSGPVSDRIVSAVADAKGVDPLEVEPLYSAVDPDAIDAMFQPKIGSPPSSLELTFVLDGCEVVVDPDGEVDVTLPAPEQGARPTAAPAHDE